MIDWALGVGELCGAIIGTVTVTNFIYYNRSQVDRKLAQLEEKLQENLKEFQKSRDLFKHEVYDKLDVVQLNLQDTMKEFIATLSDLKDSEKDKSMEFIKLLNLVKDELKNDYTARYNDLLTLLNTKANENDFTRLENKFDKLSETLIELKTIIQIQLEEKKKK